MDYTYSHIFKYLYELFIFIKVNKKRSTLKIIFEAKAVRHLERNYSKKKRDFLVDFQTKKSDF